MIAMSTILRQYLIIGIFMVSLPSFADDANDKKQKAMSADIYEKEEPATKSFSGRVNMIRETDTIEVFFDGKHKGPFILKDDPNLGLFKERLAKSQKNKNQNVSVKISDEVITSVELVEIKAPANKKSDMDSVLDDILKK
jgi:hypothetical protein